MVGSLIRLMLPNSFELRQCLPNIVLVYDRVSLEDAGRFETHDTHDDFLWNACGPQIARCGSPQVMKEKVRYIGDSTQLSPALPKITYRLFASCEHVSFLIFAIETLAEELQKLLDSMVTPRPCWVLVVPGSSRMVRAR